MNNTSDPTPEKSPLDIPRKEIHNFELELGTMGYWISYENKSYPIFMTPYHLLKLFEIEGIPIESFACNKPFRFTKAVLVRIGFNICEEIFDACGNDLTLQQCWVKGVIGDDEAEPKFTQISM